MRSRRSLNRALVVIAKRPAPGQTKTRLAPALSAMQAAQLYDCFLRDMLDVARAVPDVARLVSYWPLDAVEYFGQAAPDFELLPQHGDDLGARLDHAMTHCLTHGFDQVVIVNSDSPSMPAAHLVRAFGELDRNDVVLGPCDDGGYCLIGLTRSEPSLFREVRMSTPTVTQDTLALAKAARLRTALLPSWYDVDTIRELDRLAIELTRSGPEVAPRTQRFLCELGRLPAGR